MTLTVNILAILAGLFTIVTIIMAMVRGFKRRRFISWKEIDKASRKLFSNIKDHDYDPDMIIGVGRGGAVAAGIIATHFREKRGGHGRIIPIATIDRIYLMEHGRRRDVAIVGIHNLDVHGKKLLVLNADTYTGTTLIKAVEHLEWDHPKIIKTGCLILYKGRKPGFQPDFFGEKLALRKADRPLPWRGTEYPFDTEEDVALSKRVLVVLHGLVATGKTSVTRAISKGLGHTPIYSDWYWFKYGLRDRHLNTNVSVHHNNHMLALCLSAIGTGYDAVLDCTSRWGAFRNDCQNRLAQYSVQVVFVRCYCTESSSIDRINRRQFIGPYDFGTEFEYSRVKKEYQEINTEETAQINLVEVDTDALICKIVNCVGDEELRQKMKSIRHAIEDHYFSKLTKS